MSLLDGKLVASKIKENLKNEISEWMSHGIRKPKLVIITVGDDDASKVYVRNKIKACEEVGIVVDHVSFENDGAEFLVKEYILHKNLNPAVYGIMVQLPLPEEYDERAIIDCISPWKDVDGLTTVNIGKLRSGQDCLKPCTAQGVMDLFKEYNIEISGKNAVIVGRSNIVGKPLADLMLSEGATVTQCHSKTKNIQKIMQTADIFVSAIGKAEYFATDYNIKPGAVIVDVGINRNSAGKLVGDIVTENMMDRASYITPVPGGVGPMTVAELLVNTVKAYKDNTWRSIEVNEVIDEEG